MTDRYKHLQDETGIAADIWREADVEPSDAALESEDNESLAQLLFAREELLPDEYDDAADFHRLVAYPITLRMRAKEARMVELQDGVEKALGLLNKVTTSTTYTNTQDLIKDLGEAMSALNKVL